MKSSPTALKQGNIKGKYKGKAKEEEITKVKEKEEEKERDQKASPKERTIGRAKRNRGSKVRQHVSDAARKVINP